MIRSFQIYRLISINKTLDKLIEQDLDYPINIAYKLSKVKKEIDDTVEYIMERLKMVCGDNIDFSKLNDEESIIVNTIFSQVIDVDIPELYIDELISNEKITLSMSDITYLEFLFPKK